MNTCFLILLLCYASSTGAQNSLTGDGFGGRLWYKASNYTVGSYSAFTICGDSLQLYGWGSSTYGELGYGSFASTALPVKARHMTQVKYASCGYFMGGIKKDGSAWIWGGGPYFGSNPRHIDDDVYFLDAGSLCLSYVKNDGTVWSVGINRFGQFGNNTVRNYPELTPSKAINVKNAVRVAVGMYNMAILLSDGRVMTTGKNDLGGLGIGAKADTSCLTATIVPGLNNIVDIKGNAFNFAALDKFGHVYVWGSKSAIGFENDNQNQYSPVKLNALNHTVAISACDDGNHFLALNNKHEVFGWGGSGRVFGAGNNLFYSNQVVKVAEQAIDIMAGETFSYIIKKDKTLWAAGKSVYGSIWLNLPDLERNNFTQINTAENWLNICKPEIPLSLEFSTKNPLCVNDSIRFDIKSPLHFNTYIWNFGDGPDIAYGKSVKHKFKLPGTYHVLVYSKSIQGDIIDSFSKKVTIHHVNNNPFFNGDTTVCGLLNFLKTPDHYDAFCKYQWNDNIHSFSRRINKPGQYILTETSADLCIHKDTFWVISRQKPVARFYVNSDTQCFTSHQFNFINVSTATEGKIASYFWDFGDNTYSVFETPPAKKYTGIGSYTATLKAVTDFNCVDSFKQALMVLSSPEIILLEASSVCYGDTNTFKSESNVSHTKAYNWDFKDGEYSDLANPRHRYKTDGTYQVWLTVRGENGCKTDTAIEATVFKLPWANFKYTIRQKDELSNQYHFENTSIPDFKYTLWDWGNFGKSDKDSNITVFDHTSISVHLFISDNNNCADDTSALVQAYGPLKLFLPNVFTPGGDGLNDAFSPAGVIDDRNYNFKIFNRWGEQIFESTVLAHGWDGNAYGKPVPQDVYVYSIRMTDQNGDIKFYRGTFTLLR